MPQASQNFFPGKCCRTSHNATPARQVMAIETSPYHQCKDGTFPDSAPRRPPSVARSGHVNHAQTTPLSICLQNQPATTGKAETLPDISAERRVGTDNVFTRRHPQPRFIPFIQPLLLTEVPCMAVSAVPLPIIIVMTLSAVPAGFTHHG